MKREKLFSVDVQVIGEENARYITNVSKIRTEKDYIHFEREEGNVTFNKNFVVAYHVNSYGEPVDKNDFFQDAKEKWERQKLSRTIRQKIRTEDTRADKSMSKLKKHKRPPAPPDPPEKRKIKEDDFFSNLKTLTKTNF